ncbi:MAG: hypothetical protein ACYCW6_23530 [Candidatus Xenobia bacterium]
MGLDEGMPGMVNRTGRSAWITHFIAEPSLFGRALPAACAGLHTACAFPIRMCQGKKGVLMLFSRNTRPPSVDLIARCGRMIEQTAECFQATPES